MWDCKKATALMNIKRKLNKSLLYPCFRNTRMTFGLVRFCFKIYDVYSFINVILWWTPTIFKWPRVYQELLEESVSWTSLARDRHSAYSNTALEPLSLMRLCSVTQNESILNKFYFLLFESIQARIWLISFVLELHVNCICRPRTL